MKTKKERKGKGESIGESKRTRQTRRKIREKMKGEKVKE